MKRATLVAAILAIFALAGGVDREEPASAAPRFVQHETITAETPAETKARHKREADQRWRRKYKPFVYPSGRHWAAPYPVALCESGENYFVGPAGAYGLILAPPWMSPREQDEEAYHLLHTVGAEQAWFRWEREQGCPYI